MFVTIFSCFVYVVCLPLHIGLHALLVHMYCSWYIRIQVCISFWLTELTPSSSCLQHFLYWIHYFEVHYFLFPLYSNFLSFLFIFLEIYIYIYRRWNCQNPITFFLMQTSIQNCRLLIDTCSQVLILVLGMS